MERGIGERLREARRAQGIELEEIERRIKVRTRYLIAMEEERWDALPGTAYVWAFLRTYGDCLGLDGDELAAEHRSRSEPPRPPSEAGPGPPRRAERGPALEAGEGGRGGVSRAAALAPRWRAVAAIAIAVVVVLILVVGLAGRDGDGDELAGGNDAAPPAEESADEATSEEPSAPPRVTLELAATASVWVCLVDHRGRPVVEGETLPTGEQRGPFRARAFDLTVGNGELELLADGEPVPISDAPNPAGYRVTPERTRELSPEERPTCA